MIRYAQCWEDADVLLDALQIQTGDTCLSIASAGDNSLAMLAKHPGQVIAVDSNPEQLACLELRVAAFRTLSHAELLELVGSVPSSRRIEIYQHCRPLLSQSVREFWDADTSRITSGIGTCGKFEKYFEMFRTRVLPLVHSRRSVEALFRPRTAADRETFYSQYWDHWRWRLLFRLFFSKFAMSRLGRDPTFFRYAEGSIAERVLQRARYAVTVLDPVQNPYLQWILYGRHVSALPFALRQENFEAIRANLDRLSWKCESLHSWLTTHRDVKIHRANLSDIFEYMSPAESEQLLANLATQGVPGGRIVYWNTFVSRSRPESLADSLLPLPEVSVELHRQDKAFFYQRLVVEQVLGTGR